MTKTKLLRVAGSWLIFMGVFSASQRVIFEYLDKPHLEQQAAQARITPEVLGEITSIRGAEDIGPLPDLQQIAPTNLQDIKAKSFLVSDLASGKELLSKDKEKKLSIASLTKLLTALVAYENLDLNQTLTINANDKIQTSPIINIAVGDKVTALDVFSAMLVGSCNDAALTLANHTQAGLGKSFVELMNSQAKALGMGDSNFSNALGFDSQYNYSTAQDLQKLISTTESLAVFKNLGRRQTYEFSGELGYNYSTQATNKLIEQYPDLEAIKTGYTKGAGGAMATKLHFANHDLIILVLDSNDREGDTLKLRGAILNNFK